MTHAAIFSFGPESEVFGKTIQMETHDLLNAMVMNLLGDGLIDFYGYVQVHKLLPTHKRHMWKYLQYLWLWNSDHEALQTLAHANGNADATSFERGVREALGLEATEQLEVTHLAQFINDRVITNGIQHPVLRNLEASIMELNPMVLLEPHVKMVDPNTGNIVDLASELDGPALKVKVT